MRFTTADNDNDMSPANCADNEKNGWWHNWCSASAVNRDMNGVWKTLGLVSDVVASRMLVKLN